MPNALVKPGAALVLVVDDQPAQIQSVSNLLANSGYELMPALSGEQALGRCAQRRPELILLDLHMPGMDGFEVCARLQADPVFADLPVIFMLDPTDRAELPRVFNSGAVDYLCKPLVPEELLARVRTQVELRRGRERQIRTEAALASLQQRVIGGVQPRLSTIRSETRLLLLSPQVDDPTVRHQLQELTEHASAALGSLSETLAAWLNGKLRTQLQCVPLNLDEVIADAMAEVRTAAGLRQLQLSHTARANLSVRADRQALRQVLVRLLHNAMLHCGPALAIELQSGPGRSGHAQVNVLDRGPGLSPEQQQLLFRPDHGESEGGLVLARQQLLDLGGKLWFEPRPDGGSIFSFELPLAKG